MTSTKRLAGKVAVVTGASKGIGASIAKQLAAEGASVVVNYSSSKAGADKVVDEIKANGGKAVAVQANVAQKTEIDRLFMETKKNFGGVNILVNNAGIYEFSALANITEEHFHKHFNLNVLGLLLASQAAAKQFDDAGGSIINLSSIVSTLAVPELAVYSGTKEPWTRSRARWRPNSARAAFASMPSGPESWIPKEPGPPASPKATPAGKSRRRRRCAGLGNRRISPVPRFSSRPTTPPGSRAKHS